MLVQLLGVFAEFERATIIDRVVAGMERKAARGGWPGGTVPYGLRLDDEHHLAIEPTEFPIVERIFTRYGNERAGALTIATELNNDGHRTRTGRRFSAKVVLGILRNRGYLGEVSFRDVRHQPDQALIDPALFEKAQALLAERGESYDRRFTDKHPDYLLTGLITCGSCHRRYVGSAAHGKGHRYRYYACWTRQRYGKDACTGERIRADVLEGAVFEALVALYTDPDLIERAIATKTRDTLSAARLHQDEIAATESQLKKTEAAIERYMHAFESGSITEDMFGTRVRDPRQQGPNAPLPPRRTVRGRRRSRPQPTYIRRHRSPPTRTRSRDRARQRRTTQGHRTSFRQRPCRRRADTIQPTFYVRGELPPGISGATGEPPSDEKGFRAMTPTVGAEGLEPPTCWL